MECITKEINYQLNQTHTTLLFRFVSLILLFLVLTCDYRHRQQRSFALRASSSVRRPQRRRWWMPDDDTAKR